MANRITAIGLYRNEVLKPSPEYVWNFDLPPYPPFDLFPKHGYTGLEIGVGEEGWGPTIYIAATQ